MKPKNTTTLTVWAVLMIVAGPLFAAETVYNLSAGVTTVTMPDNTVITVWGYALDNGPVTVPGPVLTVPPGDSLRINLTNNLPGNEPVSVFIPGQAQPINGLGGDAVTRNPDGRIRSFTHETLSGETAAYVWPSLKPGSYIYQSATHPAVHIQMGLYGALKKDAAEGMAYPGVAYAKEIVLLYSEIDPMLHAAVRDGIYGTPDYPSTINYEAKYFLINGMPYTESTASRTPVQVGSNVLVRLFNAGLKTHDPTFLDAYVNVVAEDGNPYPYPREQYSLFLTAGKTLDILFSPSMAKAYPIFDRAGGMSNPANAAMGMLAYLDAANAK